MTDASTRPAGRALADTLMPAAGIMALCLLAMLPLNGVFTGAGLWIVALAGVLLGGGIAVVAALRGWGVLVVAALAVGTYFAFGGALVLRSTTVLGVLPSLDTLRELALGSVFVWKQLLTASTPVVGFEAMLLAPFIAGLAVTALAVSLALRLRRPAWAVLPPTLLLIFSIAFSTYEAWQPVALGAVFAGLAVVWLVWVRRGRGGENLAEPSADRVPVRTTALAAGSIAGALVIGLTAGALVQPPVERVVLRDLIVPPLEVHDFASPLTAYRKYMTDGEDSDLFTIEGLPAGARIRLATLDQYDGIVYRVSGDGSAGGGSFERVGRAIASDVTGDRATLSVRVQELRGVWLPDVGAATSIDLHAGAGAGAANEQLHYNVSTGTAVLTGGLAEGTEYSVDAIVPAQPDEDRLAGASVASLTVADPQFVPEAVGAFTADVTAGASTPFEQLTAIATALHEEGYYSNGLEGQVASRSGHRSERIAALLDGEQMIGDEEQYSVAMALMVSQLGYPARVVMGFRPEADAATGAAIEVTAADASVWVEVPFEGLGWVSFDPTPSKDRVPQQQVPQPEQKPQAQVLQPPPPPEAPVELPPDPPVEEAHDQEQPVDLGWLWATLRWTGIALGALVLLLGPAIAMAIARASRRRRRAGARRPVDRMSGGWAELHDTALDHGGPLPAGATRREQVAVLHARFPGQAYEAFAARADRAVFGVADPSAGEVDGYWADVRTATRGIAATAGWRARVRGFLWPRSVLRDLGARLGRRPRTGDARTRHPESRGPAGATVAGRQEPRG